MLLCFRSRKQIYFVTHTHAEPVRPTTLALAGSFSFYKRLTLLSLTEAYLFVTHTHAVNLRKHIHASLLVPLLNIVPALFSRFAFQRTQFLSEYGIRAGYIHVNTRSRRRKISCFHIKRIKRSRNYHKCHKNAMQTQKNVL